MRRADYREHMRKVGLRAEDWAVRPIERTVAERLVKDFHYAGGAANTETYCHGLYLVARPAEIVGVAWWIPPTKAAARATYPEDWQGVLALSRLVIAPGVPKNACSFLLARSRKLIDRDRWPCLVTYADEGQEHDGGIYRADGWEYVGKTAPEATFVLDGRMVARKAGPKTRTRAEMEAMGAECVGKFPRHKFIRTLPGRPPVRRRQSDLFGEIAA